MAITKGITVMHSTGANNAYYRGEACIILIYLSLEKFVIEDGEREAQNLIASDE